jgi:hypothetical protein
MTGMADLFLSARLRSDRLPEPSGGSLVRSRTDRYQQTAAANHLAGTGLASLDLDRGPGPTKEESMPRAQIKDEKTYRKLREHGESKEKSARIANAAAASSRSAVGRKGGKSGSYHDWSKPDLVKRAREIGIKGRSTMTKAELIKALRDH